MVLPLLWTIGVSGEDASCERHARRFMRVRLTSHCIIREMLKMTSLRHCFSLASRVGTVALSLLPQQCFIDSPLQGPAQTKGAGSVRLPLLPPLFELSLLKDSRMQRGRHLSLLGEDRSSPPSRRERLTADPVLGRVHAHADYTEVQAMAAILCDPFFYQRGCRMSVPLTAPLRISFWHGKESPLRCFFIEHMPIHLAWHMG